ncbi:uncharacterized protein PV06_00240 [Exophiala oligosperma]|uniref:Uncharacterized protein n=1 Tax=Exophiala oligosperma TaxID=215243 RepID=A0A0D2EHY8_9EURO|nr:uncharacterized protein PV06_00240 [Exophiala oligosperma]KIW47549.1 hypothetical protein PV06_00240 [Exophiala oligosperma]
MSTIQVVKASDAPTPVSHFSQARIWNGVVYCSGDLGLDPKTNQLVDGTTTERTVQAIRNLSTILEAAGSSLKHVIKVNVYLTTMDNFAAMNQGYAQCFEQPFPSRTCVNVVALPLGGDVEIECIAALA